MKNIVRFFVCACLLVGTEAFAASDSFIIRTLVGSDTTPPSIPAGLVATPVATTQIDLSWSSSTDDYVLSGYQVFRDEVQIATTTDTSYSDSGLSVATHYSYYVTAFDSFNNISASSSVVSTTTLSPPPSPPPVSTTTPPGQPSQGSLVRLPELTSLEIIPSTSGAVIRYTTAGYVRPIVRWGTTLSYELGGSAVSLFAKEHETTITDLKPDTTYRLRIDGENNIGRVGVLTETTFTTLNTADEVPPGNVMNLRAERRSNDVHLFWDNPRDTDFSYVRVLRSDMFYPIDTADGWIVYEGSGDYAVDADVLRADRPLFYTVFAYDGNGNISSGAIVRIGLPDVPGTTDNPLNIAFETVEFYQDNNLLLPEDDSILRINGGKHLTISVPYGALPEHLKTILVTVIPETSPTKHLSFILRINPEKTAYTARVAPLGTSGDFRIRVSVLDFNTQQIGYAEGTLRSLITTYEEDEDTLFGIAFRYITTVFGNTYLILFTFFLAILALLSRRRLERW